MEKIAQFRKGEEGEEGKGLVDEWAEISEEGDISTVDGTWGNEELQVHPPLYCLFSPCSISKPFFLFSFF